MKRAVFTHLLVLVIGFVVCAWSLHYFYGPPVAYQGPERTTLRPASGVRIAGRGSNQVRDAAKIISAYVVNIDTEGRPMIEPGSGFGFPGFFGSPFEGSREVVPRGKGSGVIFTQDGYILTNNHVVEAAAKLVVTTSDGKQYPAKLIGRDSKSDIAVIKIDAKQLSYAKFADSDKVEVGDWVIAVGNALGRGTTVTIGIVSATKRGPVEIEGKVLEQVIQTDAAINPGNSGGALADVNGDLIGINSAIASTGPQGGSIGIGFAVPSDTAKSIAAQLVKQGKVIRPYLGIMYAPYNAEIRQMFSQRGARKLPQKDGVIVRQVYQGSPAAQAGLQPMDIILKANGKALSGTAKAEAGKTTIADEVSKSRIGDTMTLEVWHMSNGTYATVGVRVGEMPPDYGAQPESMQTPGGGSPPGPGYAPMPSPGYGSP